MRGNRRPPARRTTQLVSAVLLCASLFANLAAAAAAEEQQPFCFSDICLSNRAEILRGHTLSNLGKIVDPARANQDDTVLAGVLPRVDRTGRKTLAAYTDADGAYLLDARTLPIVRKIDLICAPIGPFISIFQSASSHQTSIEFDTIAVGDNVRLGVTRIARSFQVKRGSAEEAALIADLSAKVGFQVDGQAEGRLMSLDSGEVTATFERQEGGFRLAFARRSLRSDAGGFPYQTECGQAARIGID